MLFGVYLVVQWIKNQSAKAEYMGSISSLGSSSMPHVPQQLKPVCLEPVLRNKRSHCNETPKHFSEEEPLLATARDSPGAATKTQHSQN